MGKDHKKKEKSSKRSSKGSKSHSNSWNLADALTYGLITFPTLSSELPQILTALDNNKSVMTDGIEDVNMKMYINTLMSCLPVTYSPRDGYTKVKSNSTESTVNTLSGFVINHLLSCGAIIQPSKLSSSQATSSRFASIKLLKLFEAFPSLVNELSPILTTIRDGGAVDINQLDNEEVAELLDSFLVSLGLENCDDDYEDEEKGFKLPRQSSLRSSSLDMLSQYIGVIKSYNKFQAFLSNTTQSVSQTIGDYKSFPNADSSPSQSSQSDDESSNSGSDDEIEPQKIVGPQRPSSKQLAYAQTQAAQYIYEDEDSSDEIGPSLAARDSRSTEHAGISSRAEALPLGYVGVEDINQSEHEDRVDDETRKPSNNVREDWMLTPGERDPFAGLKDGTNRKFQTGKTAKKLAEILEKQREEQEKEAGSEEALKTKAMIEELNAKRGPSLMEQHLSHVQKKPKLAGNERVPFDREKDLLSHKKMGNDQVNKLVDQAKKLDSRFSKGFIQKSFM